MARSTQQRRRLSVVAGAIVSAVFLAGVLIASVGRGSSPADAAAQGPESSGVEPSSSHGKSADPAGMDDSFARDDADAVEAAVAFATASQQWLYFSDAEIREAIQQISTADSVERLTAGVVADVSVARERLAASSGRVWWLVRPLAWDVELHDADEARVSVWVVTVLSAAGVAAPQSEWMTVTLDLEWIDGDWRVDAVRDAPGPTPMLGPQDRPWDAVPFDGALGGFTRIDSEPVG